MGDAFRLAATNTSKYCTKLMSAKGNRGPPLNKKLSLMITEPSLPIPGQDDQQIRRKTVAKDLQVKYDHISIQASDSFHLIEAIKAHSTETIQLVNEIDVLTLSLPSLDQY